MEAGPIQGEERMRRGAHPGWRNWMGIRKSLEGVPETGANQFYSRW